MPRKKKPVVVSTGNELIVQPPDVESLAAWFQLYGKVEAEANSGNTIAEKRRDFELFLHFFYNAVQSDHPDQWTKPVTARFLEYLEEEKHEKPKTINRRLQHLGHCAKFIHKHRPFLAGLPTKGVPELIEGEPEWKGLTELEEMRMKSAAEHLLRLHVQKNQDPLRTYALFYVLLNTGLRVSELVALERRQYTGKHFENIKRKGKVRTPKLFIPKEGREPLDKYLAKTLKQKADAPLFQTRTGKAMARQHVDRALRQITDQANSGLPVEERINCSAHDLRHTHLRHCANEHGVPFAMERAGHTSAQYIFIYVRPSDEEIQKKMGG